MCSCHLTLSACIMPADHHDMKTSVGYVCNPGLYAACVLLDIHKEVISKSATDVWPFGKEDGVQVSFDENTFLGDKTTVYFQVNCKILVIFCTLTKFVSL